MYALLEHLQAARVGPVTQFARALAGKTLLVPRELPSLGEKEQGDLAELQQATAIPMRVDPTFLLQHRSTRVVVSVPVATAAAVLFGLAQVRFASSVAVQLAVLG